MTTKESTQTTPKPAEEKAGDSFFRRIFSKLDDSMKAKANAQSSNSCCSGKNDKGGKCC